MKKIDRKTFEQCSTYGHSFVKPIRFAIDYYLEKENEVQYYTIEKIKPFWYVVLCIPLNIFSMFHAIWEDGLKNFELITPNYLSSRHSVSLSHKGLYENAKNFYENA